MKRLLFASLAMAVATVFAAPSFAAISSAKTKVECEQAGGVWVEQTHKCGAKKQ